MNMSVLNLPRDESIAGCRYLDDLRCQYEERLGLPEDGLTHHFAVMKGLGGESTVQQPAGVHQLVHLNATQQ